MTEEPLLLPTIVDLVRRYGCSVSHAALSPQHSIFRAPGIDGLVGFLVMRQCAVVLGDPICAPEDKTALADAFAAHCADNGWPILYVIATKDMLAYAQERGYAMMEFASLLIADPQYDLKTGHQNFHLRQHLSHVGRTGVTVQEYHTGITPDDHLEAQMESVYRRWVSARRGLQMYLADQRLFEDRSGRRWFIAELEGSIVGILSILDINCFDCHYLINIVFSLPEAPLYTNELMVVEVLSTLRKEGVRSVSFGVGPLAALGRVEGSGRLSEFLSRSIYRLASRVMSLHSKTVFWEKFHVARREPLYVLSQSSRFGLRELTALSMAFHISVT
jgi:lysylphosphatidylglycerol synthetase-like protein (DUF2156 family)